mgnify:CR=1 FL=1
MWTNAVAAMGAAVLGSSISTGAKYLADVSGAKEMYEGFAKTGTGQWFDSIFSSKGVQGTLKSVSTDLIKPSAPICIKSTISNTPEAC